MYFGQIVVWFRGPRVPQHRVRERDAAQQRAQGRPLLPGELADQLPGSGLQVHAHHRVQALLARLSERLDDHQQGDELGRRRPVLSHTQREEPQRLRKVSPTLGQGHQRDLLGPPRLLQVLQHGPGHTQQPAVLRQPCGDGCHQKSRACQPSLVGLDCFIGQENFAFVVCYFVRFFIHNVEY